MGLQDLQPATMPLTLQDVCDHLRLDYPPVDQPTVEAYLAAAVNYVEQETRSPLVARPFLLTLDCFPHCERHITLPKPPLQAITSITYVDAYGATQTLDPTTYMVDTVATPGRIALMPGKSWPSTNHQPNGIQIQFTAGYTTTPDALLQAVKLMCGSFYENREAATDRRIEAIPFAVDALIQPYMYAECVG